MTSTRPNRTAKVEARCSEELRRKLDRIPMIKEADVSDIVREALRLYTIRFDEQTAA